MPLITPAVTAVGVPRVLHTNVTPVANTVATEEDLMSFTIPAGTLANNGDILRIRARHEMSPADANILQFYASSSGINIGDPLTYISPAPVHSEIVICRSGATTGLPSWSIFGYGTDSTTSKTHPPIETEEISITWANANVIKFTATCVNGVGGEITQNMLQVVYEPTPS